MPVLKLTEWTTDSEGNIRFSVMSNGMTSAQWSVYLESKGFRIFGWPRAVLSCAKEAPTNSVVYNVIVLPDKMFSGRDRIIKKIHEHAAEKGWQTPHWEVACLICDLITDEQLKQMGFWDIMTMHRPIPDSQGNPCLLRSYYDDKGRCLGAFCGKPFDEWLGGIGFAYVI